MLAKFPGIAVSLGSNILQFRYVTLPRRFRPVFSLCLGQWNIMWMLRVLLRYVPPKPFRQWVTRAKLTLNMQWDLAKYCWRCWMSSYSISQEICTQGFCFAVLCCGGLHWLIFPYPPGLLHWHCGNLTIAPVPAKQPWWIWINTSCEFIMNDCITTTKQSTTKPCAYFLGYTVWGPFH